MIDDGTFMYFSLNCLVLLFTLFIPSTMSKIFGGFFAFRTMYTKFSIDVLNILNVNE